MDSLGQLCWMRRYLLRRLGWIVPTLWLITVLIFALVKLAPGDPLGPLSDQCNWMNPRADYEEAQRCLAELRQRHGLDLPPFYLTLTTLATPKDWHRIPPQLQQQLRLLLFAYGNWEAIDSYWQRVIQLRRQADALRAQKQIDRTAFDQIYRLSSLSQPDSIPGQLRVLARRTQSQPTAWAVHLQSVQQAWEQLETSPKRWRNFVPMVYWHGLHNQYHAWLMAWLEGDMGLSYGHQRPVQEVIAKVLPWTLRLALAGTLLVFLLGIPLGVAAAMYPQSGWDRGTVILGLILEVLPMFWVGTVLYSYFADVELVGRWAIRPEYFPGTADWVAELAHMPLPLVAYLYGNFAVLSRLLRSTLQEHMQQPYIRTALAKGLSYSQAVWRHALRNSLLPLITVATGTLPSLLVGSVVIDRTFHIHAMGELTLQATLERDLPFVMAVFTLVAILTLLSYALADVVSAWVDPRVRMSLGGRHSK